MPAGNAVSRLEDAPWMTEVSPGSRQTLFHALQDEHTPDGAVLLEQGKPNDRLSFLTEGTVTIVRSHPDGRHETVANLAAPAVFGETSFFRGVPSLVTIRATSPVRRLILTRAAYNRLRSDDPHTAEQLALAAVRVLAERFDILDKRVSDALAQHPEGHPRANEWADFRARLFEEPSL
jgi:CRP-like cAMP-binding protein